MGDKEGNRDVSIDAWLGGMAEPAGRNATAGWAAFAAARDFEWQDDHELALLCLEKAVEFWRRAEGAGEAITRHGLPASQLAMAEALRRLGRFEEARRCCHRGLSGRPADPIRSLLEFEQQLITSGDTEAHPVAEVICGRH